jgi:hypothetical protein
MSKYRFCPDYEFLPGLYAALYNEAYSDEAIPGFALNLRELLLAPPAALRVTLRIGRGFFGPCSLWVNCYWSFVRSRIILQSAEIRPRSGSWPGRAIGEPEQESGGDGHG